MKKRNLLVLLFVISVVFSYLRQRARKNKYLKEYKVKSMPWCFPLLGNSLDLAIHGFNSGCQRMRELIKKQGKVILIHFFDIPFFTIAHPDLVKVILTSKYSIYDRARFEQSAFDELLGGGLILQSNGEKWKAHRNMLSSGFQPEKLNKSVGVISNICEQNFGPMLLKHSINTNSSELKIDVQDMIQHTAFAIMAEFALGIPLPELEELNGGHSVSELWHGLLDHVQKRIIPIPYWRFIQTPGVKKYNHAMAFLKSVIHLAIQRELAKSSKSETLLACMVQQHQATPDQLTLFDIQQHALTFLFAGHDTTSNLMTMGIYHICSDEKILKQCMEEMEYVFGPIPMVQDRSSIPFQSPVTLAQLKELRFLKMVLKETLRMYPGAPFRGRYLTQDDTPLPWIHFEKGTQITLDFYDIHMNPDVWENPDTFDPNRFSEENEANRASMHFVPFGGGSRKCIGEQFAFIEALLVCSFLLRKFEIKFEGGTVIEREVTLTMRNKYPLIAQFIHRY